MRARAASWIAAASVALTIGCNAATRHDVLSFFFDGVDEPAVDQFEHERALRAAAYSLEGQDDSREPYAMNPCSECHASPESMYASVSSPRERPSTVKGLGVPPTTAGAIEDTVRPVPRDTQPAPVRPSLARGTPSPVAVSAPVEKTPARETLHASPEPNVVSPSVSSIAKASPESLAGDRAGLPGINLQVAAFANPENATALKDKLAPEFRTVRIDELPAHGKMWYRVRIGPLATQADADRTEERLRAMGHVPVRYGKP